MAIKNLSDVHITAGLQDKDGQLGTSGQILSSTGSQVDWINQEDIVAGETDKAKSVTIRVKNSTATAMSKGQVICEAVSASPPNGNLIEVALADNNGTNTMPALGILNEDLDAAGGANDEGDAIMFGKVSGISTSAFSVGDEVFVDDTPGGLTTTKPTGTKYIQKVGVVIRDDASNGTIEVFGAGRVNDVPTPLYVDHANQRLGIGATSPLKPLDVNGEALFRDHLFIGGHGENDSTNSIEIGRNRTGNGICFFDMTTDNTTYTDYGFRLIRYSGVNASTELIHRGTGDFRLKAVEASNMRFITGNSARMSITSIGQVGVGTTSPNHKLDVNGEAKFGNYGGILLTDNSATSYVRAVNNHLNLRTTRDTDDIYFSTGTTTTTKMFIQGDTGNVGIGTISPSKKLHISDSGNPKILIQDTSGDNQVAVIYKTTNYEWTAGLHGGEDAFKISNSDTFNTNDYFTIKNSGNVGIGTISPSVKLQVNGTVKSSGLDVDGQGNSSTNFLQYTRTDSTQPASISYDGTGGFDFNLNGGTVKFSDTNGGSVGIGTTSPAQKLHVVGTGEFGDATAYALKLKSSSGARGINIIDSNGTNRGGIDWNGSDFVIRNSIDSDLLKINYSSKQANFYGNVGIGTTSPQYQLHSYSEIGTQTLRLGYGVGYARITTDDASKPLDLQIGGSTKLSVNQNGNVGIGETSPSEKLVVRGGNYSGNQNGGIAVQMGNEGGSHWKSAIKIKSNGSGVARTVIEATTGQIAGQTNDAIEISQGGNVGIKKTSSTARLDVSGAIVSRGGTYSVTNESVTNAAVVVPQNDKIYCETSGGYLRNLIHMDSSDNIRIGQTSTSLINDMYLSTGNSGIIRFETTGSESMRINSVGNVGIGTTSPSTALQVVGAVTATNFYIGNSGTMQLFDYTGNLHVYSTSGTDILLGGGVGNRQNDVTIGNGNLDVVGKITADNFVSVQGTDPGNPSATSEELRLSGYGILGNRSAMYITNGHSTGTLRFGVGSPGNHGSNVKMLLHSSGNMGVGTTSPDARLHLAHSDTNNGLLLEHSSQASGFQIIQNIRQTEGLIFQKWTNGSFTSNLMTLGYDGDVGIGTTSPSSKLDVNGAIRAGSGTSNGFEIDTGYGVQGMKNHYGSLYLTTSLYVGGVAGISYKAVSASAFNVNSDYRLKTNVTALENAIERVKKLNVCRFNWKDRLDEEKVDGFIAHEVSEVIPEAVTGDKDATREDGTLDPQQIDQSKVVPLLTAALKEAIEKIEQLENRIQTLENN